jgi:hypothetical protein
MKIKPEHQAHIKAEIEAVLTKYPNIAATYEAGQFPRAESVKDLQTRFSWDLFYAAGLSSWVYDNIHVYDNDAEVSSLLNKICPKVTRRY